MNQVVDFINVNRDRYVEELKQYLAIPSISALPEHAADVKRAAERIGGMGPRAVVVKGGHASFAPAVDILWDAEAGAEELHPDGPVRALLVPGTGCTLSAAIAARLALGETTRTAVTKAKKDRRGMIYDDLTETGRYS